MLLAIVLAGLTSLTGMVYEPAVAAITPETVPENDLAAANTLRNTVDNVAIVAGPAIGAAAARLRPGMAGVRGERADLRVVGGHRGPDDESAADRSTSPRAAPPVR